MVPPIVVWVRLGSLALPVPQAPAAAETKPIPLTCKHLVEPVPAEEITKLVVEAVSPTERLVLVAEVEVESVVVKLVTVEEAELARICPKVESPLTESDPNVPTEVREEPVMPEPRVLEVKTERPPIW